MIDWVDRDLVIYSLKRMLQEPRHEDLMHNAVIEMSNTVINMTIEMVKRVPSNMPCPAHWKEEKDD